MRKRIDDLAGFWISLAASLLVLVVFALGSAACSSKRTTTTQTDSTRTEHRHEAVTAGSDFADWHRHLLQWAADSITLRFQADSVVTSSGEVYYNPSFEAGVSAPRVSEADEGITAATDSLKADISEDVKSETHHESDKQSQSVAISEPPSRWWWTIIAIAVIALALWWRRR